MRHLLIRRCLLIGVLALTMALGPRFAEAGSSSHGTSLSIKSAFARATIGAGKTGAAYLTIHNPTGHSDKLIGARTSAAKRAALHTHLHENGVMKMRPIDAVEIPAHGMAALKPGGDHLMLMGLTAPLKQGEHFSVTLILEKAGEIDVKIKVGAVGATSAGHGGHKN
jgi:periplasmic copper chaperone A